MSTLGSSELLIALSTACFLVLSVSLVIWNVLDVSRRSPKSFETAGRSRRLWIILPLVLTPLGLGWLVSLFYLVFVRSDIQRPPVDWD